MQALNNFGFLLILILAATSFSDSLHTPKSKKIKRKLICDEFITSTDKCMKWSKNGK